MASIHLRNLSVEFPVYQGGSRSLKKMLLHGTTQGNLAKDAQERINVRALNNLNFDLKDGDRLGLIGPNGSGKTTLLRVMAGAFQPSQGRLHSTGKAMALLDPQVGLSDDSTGYENMILKGMFMGIPPHTMRKYVNDIAEFTELGYHLDMPVRTYSAGMRIRLAFGITTCIRPDILLMDEWLAAGDARFMAKAQERMESFVRHSSVMVLASHSLDLLSQWCNLGLFLENGHVRAFGTIEDVLKIYQSAESLPSR